MYKTLKLQIQKVIAQSQLSQQNSQILIDCLTESLDLEVKYAKGIEKVAIRLQPINEYLSQTFAIKVSLSLQLVDQIKEEIVHVKEVLQQQKQKPMIELLKRWDYEMNELLQEIQDAEQNLKTKKKEYEIDGVTDIINLTFGYDRQIQYSQKLRNQFQAMEYHYKQLTAEYQNLIQDKQIDVALDALERFEEERMNEIKDLQLKSLVYESSMHQSLLYDMEKVANRLHDLNPKEGITQFVNKTYKDTKYTIIESQSFITNALQNPMKKSTAQEINPKLEDNSDEQFIMYLEQRYHAGQLTLTVEEFVIITNLSLQLIEKVLNDIHKAFEMRETYLLHQLIKYSFVFFVKDTQQRYLQEMLIQHKIWQYRDLWETLLIQQIIQLRNQSREQQNGQILVILTHTCQQMLMFTVPVEMVKDITIKFSQYFKLNKEVCQDLIVKNIILNQSAIQS